MSLEAYLNKLKAIPIDKGVMERYQKNMVEDTIPKIMKYQKEQRELIHKARFNLKEARHG